MSFFLDLIALKFRRKTMYIEIHINLDNMQEYCSLFEESRAIITQKLSGRRQEIQDQWKKVGRRNVVPGQQFHLLLSNRELSPEALGRKARRIANPKKVVPSKLLFLLLVEFVFYGKSHKFIRSTVRLSRLTEVQTLLVRFGLYFPDFSSVWFMFYNIPICLLHVL